MKKLLLLFLLFSTAHADTEKAYSFLGLLVSGSFELAYEYIHIESKDKYSLGKLKTIASKSGITPEILNEMVLVEKSKSNINDLITHMYSYEGRVFSRDNHSYSAYMELDEKSGKIKLFSLNKNVVDRKESKVVGEFIELISMSEYGKAALHINPNRNPDLPKIEMEVTVEKLGIDAEKISKLVYRGVDDYDHLSVYYYTGCLRSKFNNQYELKVWLDVNLGLIENLTLDNVGSWCDKYEQSTSVKL